MILKIVYIILTYLVGAVPFALIVSKFKHVDLSKIGSGNLGATNVYRALGMKYAVLVFVLDSIKGCLPVLIAIQIWDLPWYHILVGFTAIIGHSLSLFAGFKGGKGAATGVGVLFAISPSICLILGVLAAIIITATRYVALGTITCAALVPIFLFIMNYPVEYVIGVGIVSVFVIIRHKKNIIRLVKGEENKI
ncbi:glycerol-3-phosphate 1-O-acyltransferase PlsY [Thermoproteota archaeon]